MTHALTPAGLKPQEARIYLERLYRGAFAETTAPILVTRFDNGVVVEANFAWLNLTGFSLADILGKTIAQIGHWPDKATRHEAYALVRDTGGMRDHEAPVQTKEGQRLLVQLNCSCVDVMGELLVLTHVKDITQERLAQQALQNGEMAMESLNKKLLHQIQLFEMMEDLALVGHWTAQPGGQTIEWSQGLHRIAGSSLSGLLTLDQSRGGILAEDLPGFMAARQRMDDDANNNLTAPQVVASNGLVLNANTNTTSYTIGSGNNAMSVGPFTTASGTTITVPSGSRWVIL